MNVALTLSITPATNVTACALVRMRTEKGIAYDIHGVGTPYANEVEAYRAEFVACGDFAWMHEAGSGWQVYTRTEARARYKSLVSEGFTAAPAKIEVVGQCETPKRTQMISWGEGANRMGNATIPAQVGPVLRFAAVYGRPRYTAALHAHSFTTPDKYTSLRTEFTHVAEGTESATVYVAA